MNTLKVLLLFLLVHVAHAQTENKKMSMADFSPKSKAYSIYYPKNYLVAEEDADAIVTFTDSESGLNITISSHAFDKKIEEEQLIAILSGFVTAIKKSDWKSYKSKFDNLIEGRINKENDHWIWWGITLDEKVVFISINKSSAINDDEINLLRFMIDRLEIH